MQDVHRWNSAAEEDGGFSPEPASRSTWMSRCIGRMPARGLRHVGGMFSALWRSTVMRTPREAH